jgi:tetratricopeptide (TPR) repeat protein
LLLQSVYYSTNQKIMNRNKLLISILLCCFSLSMGITSCKEEKKEAIPALLAREKQLGTAEEQTNIKSLYDKSTGAIKKNPEDLQQYVNLASVFVAEGRITGNNNYYGNAAMEMLNKVLENKTANKDIVFQALNVKSAIELNMHQFKDALATAKQGVALNNFNAGIFGALVDANVEMGNYDDAVKDCDSMMNVRPDLRSYSRASYLRQIYGQNDGAIEAMKMAVQAGLPGSENTEWARTTLGDLYLNFGKLDSASFEYRSSLVYRPNYPYALIGLARVEKAKKNYDGAIEQTRNAIKVLSEVAFVALLGDLYELKGDAAKAKETKADVIRLLSEGQKSEEKTALVKHNVSREMATANLSAGNLEDALKYANTDLEMRPNNIDANELAAWVYYLKGDYANAKAHAEKMLVTNMKNPASLYKAGAIFASAGDVEKGNKMMAEATAMNPYLDAKIISQTKQPIAANK